MAQKETAPVTRPVSPATSVLGRMISRKALRQAPWLPVIILAAMVFVSVFAPWLTPHSPNAQSLPDRRAPPAWVEGGSTEYLLGTDSLGRDILTRVLYGTRVTASVSITALLIGGAIGLILGIVAGYTGGRVDGFIMRTVDAKLAFPTILFALLLAVTMGQGLITVIIALIVVVWASFARIIRGEVLSLKQREYVTGAVAIGCSHFRIMSVHILPMVFNTFMVVLSLNAGGLIITEATLSFLGAGVPPQTPTWGQMIADGRRHIYSAWWMTLFPGLAITAVVLAFNLLGDWVRDRLDPRLRNTR